MASQVHGLQDSPHGVQAELEWTQSLFTCSQSRTSVPPIFTFISAMVSSTRGLCTRKVIALHHFIRGEATSSSRQWHFILLPAPQKVSFPDRRLRAGWAPSHRPIDVWILPDEHVDGHDCYFSELNTRRYKPEGWRVCQIHREKIRLKRWLAGQAEESRSDRTDQG